MTPVRSLIAPCVCAALALAASGCTERPGSAPESQPTEADAPSAEELAVGRHEALADRGLARLETIVATLRDVAAGSLSGEDAGQRIRALVAEINADRTERLAMGTDERPAVVAVYTQREARRGELFGQFNAVSMRLRDHKALLLETQVAVLKQMNAIRFDAQ